VQVLVADRVRREVDPVSVDVENGGDSGEHECVLRGVAQRPGGDADDDEGRHEVEPGSGVADDSGHLLEHEHAERENQQAVHGHA
jgi:hypothetical protein